MKDYTKTDPEFSEEIRVVETTDRAHADNINAAPKQLLQNTLCNRKSIEELKKSIGTGDAGEYNVEVGYHAGGYCLHDGVMYKCLEDTEGEWNPESWQETSPVEEIVNLSRSLDSLISLFRTDAEGNLLQLGEAAFAGISHNFVTEDPNFVAGADLLKILKEQVDEQNSALEGADTAIKQIYMDHVGFTDANLLPISSYGYVFNTSQNVPPVSNGSLIFTGGVSDRKFQICFGTNGKFYTRLVNTNNAWTEWTER